MRILLALTATIFLAACEGGNGDRSGNPNGIPDHSVRIVCVETSNDDDASCEDAGEVMAFSAASADDGQDRIIVRRNEIIRVHGVIENETSDYWAGYYTLGFNAPCDPADPPWVMAENQYMEIAPGGLREIRRGGACGGMPLGDHELTLTVYDADALTVRDEQIVEFTLIDEEYEDI